MGFNLGAFATGAAQGALLGMQLRRFSNLEEDRKRELADREASANSTADALQAQQGIKQKVAGPQPTDASGQEVAGPPQPKFETVYDPDKEYELQVKAMRDIAKAHGPEAAWRLNEMFRVRQDQLTRAAAADALSAVEAGRYDDVAEAFNRVRTGGHMDSFKHDGKDGFVVQFRGEEKPRSISKQEFVSAIAAKSSTIDKMLDREFNERQLAITERRAASAEKHQADTLAEQIRSNKENEGIRREYYLGRNANQADANTIRAMGVSARREKVDQLHPDSMYKTSDVLSGEESIDLNGKNAAKRLHEAYVARGYDDDAARAMSFGAITEARRKSGGDPKRYMSELNGLLNAAAGKKEPEKKEPPPADKPPVAKEPTKEPSKPAAARGIKPEAPRDPLAGIGDEQARKIRTKLLAERKRYEGRPEAAARIKEIDAIIERIDRRDY